MATQRRKAAEALLSLRILAVAVCVPALLRLRLSHTAALLEPRGSARRPAGADEIAWLVDRIERVLGAGWPFVRTGCLTRGVTLYYFLRRAGVDVRLAFGMGTPEGDFAGHCWLVRDGEPYLEKTDPRASFREIYSIPPQPHATRA